MKNVDFEHFLYLLSSKKRRWIHDPNEDFIKSYRVKYQSGFHSFVHKHYALGYKEREEVVYRVLLKDVVSTGLQDSTNIQSLTVVARNIYIMERVTN